MAPFTADPNVNRRALLAAGGLVLPAVLVTAACSRGGDEGGEKGESKESGEVTANEDLMREHGVLRRILIVYREVAPKLVAAPSSVDASALASAATLFRNFGERYHEQMLEEQHIFPIVRKAGRKDGALIDTLLVQHARGREITAYILDRTKAGRIATGDGEALARAMTGFTRMYEAHAAREDTMVFPEFKKSISEKTYKELGEQFEEIEHKQFGGDGFDIALDKVSDIEGMLGLSNLTDYTPPPPPTV